MHKIVYDISVILHMVTSLLYSEQRKGSMSACIYDAREQHFQGWKTRV